MNKIFVFALAALGTGLSAQSIGTSPYAAFGLGDVKYDNSIDITSMGGVSAAYIPDYNNSFNFSNPAANFNLELTSLRGQFTNENVKYKSDYNNYNKTKHSNYISGFSVAMPLSSKVKFGIGYQPYSSKSYTMSNVQTLAGSDLLEATSFRGEGTINTVEAAFSYQVFKGFGLGFKTNFNFGKIYDIQELTYENAELISGYETSNKVKSFNFTAGAVYQHVSSTDHKFTAGATYQFGNSGTMDTHYTNSTYYLTSNEKKNVNIIEQKSSRSKNLIPQTVQVGLGYGLENRWFASAQLDYQSARTINFLGKPFDYQDSYKVSAGGWFVPNANDFRSYFNRVMYRYGAFYQKGALNINGKDINSYGLSLGANFPIKPKSMSFSSIDVGLEFGKRGTVKNNLVQEGFFNLKIGFNFADRWFIKSVYN
ncbi:hypothetical protein [Elizabethkingia sp. JS20170427COW]|uniref:hypothetical protein n=1 Tax=Elizabethkingia sp. JS20170427COW TaxID=2583851 RepID=UPI001110E41E|nr:hypothetical protein [Elizabethkingia sp. JS20170427COW]QCX54113.1 hypothetical protein FGE20_10370 [Elizabethkingia sp. JS20170427COW]